MIKKKRLTYILITAVAVIIATVAAVLFLPTVQQSETRGNTVGNNGSYGIAVNTPEGVFYASEGILLYADKAQTSKVVCTDEAMFLNYLDGYLYYSNTGEQGALYRIRTDGSGREMISSLRTESIEIFNGTVYFATTLLGGETSREGVGIYRYTPRDGQIVRLSSIHADHLACINNLLFFADKDNGYVLSSIHLDGTDPHVIGEDFIHTFDISGQYIYFSSVDGIYRMCLDGTGKTMLADISATSLIAADAGLYCVLFDALSPDASGGLIYLTLNGERKTVSNTSFMAVNTMDEGYLIGAAYSATGMNMVRFNPSTGDVEILPAGSNPV